MLCEIPPEIILGLFKFLWRTIVYPRPDLECVVEFFTSSYNLFAVDNNFVYPSLRLGHTVCEITFENSNCLWWTIVYPSLRFGMCWKKNSRELNVFLSCCGRQLFTVILKKLGIHVCEVPPEILKIVAVDNCLP